MSAASRINLPLELKEHYNDLHQDLGIGGFARVILAKHKETGVKVAIKIVYKEAIKNELFRIHDEIQIMKKLYHQNICKLFQVSETDEHFFMILEYISGGELYDQIVHNHRMTEKEARRIFRQVLSAVGYIHSCGIAHRDLKPENILIDEMKNIRLIDFGLSANPSGGLINPLDTLCGSIAYAAPELLSGKPYLGNEVDVWSMGVLLFTLLCGYLPFDNDNNIQNALNNIKKGVFEFSPGISKDAKDLISCMLEPDPKKRHTVWTLANHEWITKGYGSAVNWGVLSQKPSVDLKHVAFLANRYQKSNCEIEKMIHNRALNEITAHYEFLKISENNHHFVLKKHMSDPLELSQNTNLNCQKSLLSDNYSLPRPKFEDQTFVIVNDENSTSLNNKVPLQIHVKNNNIDNTIDLPIPKNKSKESEKPSENTSDSVAKTKSKFIGRLAELFTPKRNQNPPNSARILKPAGNIRIVNSCSDIILQTIFDSILLELKNSGSLLSVKFENSKRHRLVFTLEICKVSSMNQLQCGILTKRIKGDSWEYKQAIEAIINLLVSKHNLVI